MARIKLMDLEYSEELDEKALSEIVGGFGDSDIDASSKGADNKSGGTAINYGNMTGGGGGGVFNSNAYGTLGGNAGGGNASAFGGGGLFGGGNAQGGTAGGGSISGGNISGGGGGNNSISAGGSYDNLSENITIPITLAL